MRIFGKQVSSRQIILFASGVLFLASTTYDVHRSIKNNQTPPTEEQIKALQDYLKSDCYVGRDTELAMLDNLNPQDKQRLRKVAVNKMICGSYSFKF